MNVATYHCSGNRHIYDILILLKNINSITSQYIRTHSEVLQYFKGKLKLRDKLNVFFHRATYRGRTIELSESYLVPQPGFFYTLTSSGEDLF